MKFLKPSDLVIIENNDEYILRKGFIHINEVTIDKLGSSEEFLRNFQQFIKSNFIELNDDDNAFGDFKQLLQFGLINIETSKSFKVIVGKDDILIGINNSYPCEVIRLEDVLSHEDCVVMNEYKDPQRINNIIDRFEKIIGKNNDIYYLDELRNITSLRAVNRITKALKSELTLGFYDNSNVYVTRIKHGYTGCFECLERHIISKFPHDINYYINEESLSEDCSQNFPAIMMLNSLILQDMKNVIVYGNSTLLGQVIHYYLPNYEYSYNINRRHISCPTCAGINNVMFREQNMRAVNAFAEARNNDKI
ncbi:MAG: hypothetical protein MR488_01775 [Lachnospiraceae bacterium]|nr:hypothetical protein [Lachnospiraceae bacterium]HIH35156.1 hypothetical protein [Methanosphaera sp.]